MDNQQNVPVACFGCVQFGLEFIKLFMLNWSDNDIYHAHKCLNANNCWHLNIYLQDKYNICEF